MTSLSYSSFMSWGSMSLYRTPQNSKLTSEKQENVSKSQKIENTSISTKIQDRATTVAWTAPIDKPTSALGWLKGLFITPDCNIGHVQRAKKSFEEYFFREASGPTELISPELVDVFEREVQGKFDAIVQSTFEALPLNLDGSINGKDFAASMKNAGAKAVRALDYLKMDAARYNLLRNIGAADYSPTIIPHNGEFVVVRPAPQIENLVLRGGGAKGLGYGPALDELERAGFLAGLKNLAGSSAGAMTAALLASGISAAEFENSLSDALFRPSVSSLLSGGNELARLYPDLKMGRGISTALESMKLMDQASAESVASFLDSSWNDDVFQTKLTQLDPKFRERLNQLRQPPNFAESRQGKMVTFGDLKNLHEMAPEKFKNLTLIGWNKTDKKESYFNAHTAANIPVVYAARISMAFPIAFKTVSYDINGSKKTFADGGIGSNMPVEVFTDPVDENGTRLQLDTKVKEEINARTLLLTFDDNGAGYKIMHGSRPEPHTVGMFDKFSSFLASKITSHPNLGKAELEDNIKVWNAGPNSLPVFHGKVGTLSFGISEKTAHNARMEAAWKAMEQIEHRVNQAYSTRHANLEEVAALLTPIEKSALQELPNPDPYQAQLLALLSRDQVISKQEPLNHEIMSKQESLNYGIMSKQESLNYGIMSRQESLNYEIMSRQESLNYENWGLPLFAGVEDEDRNVLEPVGGLASISRTAKNG